MKISHHDSLNTEYVTTFSSVLMVTSVLGYGVYIWYLSTNETNTSRLLNNLYGHLAAVGSLASLCLWIEILMFATFTLEEDSFYCLLEIISHAISILFIIMIFEISLATVLNHFKPQIYLEASVIWNNAFGFFINLVTALIDLFWTLTSCEHCDKACFDGNRLRVLLFGLPAAMMISLIVIIDDVWGWERLLAKVRYMFSKHGVTPVIVITPTFADSTLGEQVNDMIKLGIIFKDM